MSRPSVELATSDSWAFFFDFDGTLVEIADRPDAIIVPHNLSGHLATLAARVHGALALITGRRIAEIDRLLSPHRLDVAGVHGAELRLARKTMLAPQAPGEGFAEVLRQLCERFGSTGLLIEDKGFAVAVHWRLRPEYEADVLKFMNHALTRLGGHYRLQLGKSVAELVPVAASKEGIIQRFLASAEYRNRRPAFFGDDLTDEAGFDLVNRVGGISVRIGAGPSMARYRQPTASALRERLEAWAHGAPFDPERDLV